MNIRFILVLAFGICLFILPCFATTVIQVTSLDGKKGDSFHLRQNNTNTTIIQYSDGKEKVILDSKDSSGIAAMNSVIIYNEKANKDCQGKDSKKCKE